MAILKREDVLSAKLRHEVVPVPEWGGDVCVWVISAARCEELKAAVDGGALSGATIAAACVGDEAGPYSPPLTAEELRERLSVVTCTKVISTALRINGMSGEAAEEARGN